MEAVGARGAIDLATSMSPVRNVNKKDVCYIE
jgi:hypothetical protein